MATPETVQAVAYAFPLRMAPSLSDYAGFRVSAFVDHNSTTGQALDYNGGSRTYDSHHGTDYALWPFNWNKVDTGEVQVIAAAAGTIVNKVDVDSTDHNPCDGGSSSDSWNYVAIIHADGRLTIYGHMRYNSLTTKSIGETVAQGEYLGTVASSGNSSGPHLHFEIRFGSYSNTEWIDRYAGPGSQPESLWASQRPYLDSAINKLSTHSAQPIDTPCQPTVTNLQNSFTTPSRICYYRTIKERSPRKEKSTVQTGRYSSPGLTLTATPSPPAQVVPGRLILPTVTLRGSGALKPRTTVRPTRPFSI